MLERVYLMIANHLIKIVNHVLALYSGNLENFGNVQNEQFPRRHFYVPFGEFVHLHILKCCSLLRDKETAHICMLQLKQ